LSRSRKAKSKAWRWIAWGVPGAIALFMGYACQQVYSYAAASSDAFADAAIVLGAAAWGDRPSPVFAERIQHAIDLYHQGRVRALVFTGGRGAEDEAAESEVARIYALRQGVPAAHIYCETASHITHDNLKRAQAIMQRERLQSALLVSDPLHMRRSMQIARDLGMEVYPSPTPTSRYVTWHSKAGFLLRETRLYAGYLLSRPWNH
jgi:uncharacterized SAM-binding protein YcdF (DUF218 family)